MLTDQLPLVWTLIWALVVGNLIAITFLLFICRWAAMLTFVNGLMLVPFIVVVVDEFATLAQLTRNVQRKLAEMTAGSGTEKICISRSRAASGCAAYPDSDRRGSLSMGMSKPWPDALEALTGTKAMDASAILDYFAPLKTWLDEQLKGKEVGW